MRSQRGYGFCSYCARTADEIATEADCNPRLVREWLDGQVAAGLIQYHADTDSYEMSAEAGLALADESSPVFTARAMNAFASMFLDMEKLKAADVKHAGDPGWSTLPLSEKVRRIESESPTEAP